jgi:hypothetical protein
VEGLKYRERNKVDPYSGVIEHHGCPGKSSMVQVQKTLLDFVDIPCALIVKIDGKSKTPPIRMTKDDLEYLLRRNRDEWNNLTVHFLDGTGVPIATGPVDLARDECQFTNHFLI